jgi:hypothetical protein
MIRRPPAAQRRPGHRAGYALIENLIVISLLTAVSLTSAWMLHLLFKLDMATRGEVAAQQTRLHLAERYQTDVRGARRAAANAEQTELTLEQPTGEVVRYRLLPDVVERTVARTDGTRAHYERYLFPATEPRLTAEATGSRICWSLTLVTRTPLLSEPVSRSPTTFELALRATTAETPIGGTP